MAKKPESRYIDKVHRQFDKYEYGRRIRMQMGMGSPAGIPDMLYQGKRDLWIEYKYVPDLTKIRKIPWNKLSSHQHDWIETFLKLNSVNSIALIIGDEQSNGIFICLLYTSPSPRD